MQTVEVCRECGCRRFVMFQDAHKTFGLECRNCRRRIFFDVTEADDD